MSALLPALLSPRLPSLLGLQDFGAPGTQGGGGIPLVAPVNTVAPVASGTVTIGGTLSCTTGTWTGTPTPTFTYQWRRGGVSIGGATASTYTPVAADIDDTVAIDCVVTATNAAGAASQDSNNLSFAPDTSLPCAVGLSTSGITTADAGATADQWAAIHGAIKAEVVLAAPAATNRPAYSATGGPGGIPLVSFDGTDNVLRDTAVTKGSAWSTGECGIAGRLTAGTATDRIITYGAALMGLLEGASTVLRGVTTTPSVTSNGTTAFVTTYRQGSFDYDGTNQRVRVSGSVEDTDAASPAGYADGQGVALGASAGGTAACQVDVVAWWIGPGLTASQRADLAAFITNKVGV